jgi:hydroxyacylglutathione hydrolase
MEHIYPKYNLDLIVIFKQFYLQSLGHASYLIGSEETGEALVLDVRRDVEQYFNFARDQGVCIRYAADTHQHNDYLTGICELPQRSPVEILASARAELGYEARPLNDGERLKMGEVEFEVLHTPGHTPEHISLVVRDHARGEEPVILFSGGALLVDDVARPDLLGGEDEAHQAARALGESLKDKILTLPDHVMVFPTHVAGSLCGGNIGSMLFTTIGYEKRMNQMLQCIRDEQEFVKQCIDFDSLPTVPPYWPRMRKQNQTGPKPVGVLAEPPALNVKCFAEERDRGALVLDCRLPEAFGGAHIPRAYNVGLTSSFPTWAGSILPPDIPILLVLDWPSQLWEATWHLLRIGYDLPRGWLAEGMQGWRTSGGEIERIPQWTVSELYERQRSDHDLLILDVRQPGEWQAGHVPGVKHIPGATLAERMNEVPQDRPVAIYCGIGYRSSVATSVLRAKGHKQVFNVLGGFSAWQARGLPVER